MPRKKNEQQELLNEQEEFGLRDDGNIDTATAYNDPPAPSSENEVLLVNQTYLTEDTLPRINLQQTVEHDEELDEEENEYETEQEEDEGAYAEDETEYKEEDDESYAYEDSEVDEESEYEYEEEAGEPSRSKISQVIDRVMALVKDADGNLDKAQIAKYAGIAVLGIYGLSRKSILGKILISGVVSLLAKQLLDSKAAKHERKMDGDEAVAA